MEQLARRLLEIRSHGTGNRCWRRAETVVEERRRAKSKDGPSNNKDVHHPTCLFEERLWKEGQQSILGRRDMIRDKGSSI